MDIPEYRRNIHIKTIALDKTRTITFGNPIVSDIFPLNGTSREELLACTAGAEIFSEHPLAQTIVDASKKEGFEPHKTEAFKSIMGKGATPKCLVCEDVTLPRLERVEKTALPPSRTSSVMRNLSSLPTVW